MTSISTVAANEVVGRPSDHNTSPEQCVTGGSSGWEEIDGDGDDRAAPSDQGSILDGGGKVDPDALFKLYEAQTGDDEEPISVRFVLSRDLNKRLDRYLVDRIPFLSRTSLQRLIRERAVTVNGRVPKQSTRLRLGDEVIAVLPPPPSRDIPPEPIPLDILYEDDHLIVINKQDDIIVHPARGNRSGTLINALSYHFQQQGSGSLSTVGEEFARPGIVHRLDRHTTGVMVVAKSDTAHWRLGRQFEQRKTQKRYLAVVHGRLEPHADVIDMPLGKHPTIREKYAVRWDETGKASVTIYHVREMYDDFTLVELDLKTGRTHQIRVHLSHIGFPIVGDDMYGGRHLTEDDLRQPASRPVPGPGITGRPEGDEASSNRTVIARQALHATTLSFTNPISRKPMSFTAPLCHDMRRMIDLLRQWQSPQPIAVSGAEIDLDLVMGVRR